MVDRVVPGIVMGKAKPQTGSVFEELWGNAADRAQSSRSTFDPSESSYGVWGSDLDAAVRSGIAAAEVAPSSLVLASAVREALDGSTGLWSEQSRSGGATSLVHELLSTDLASAEPSSCRCPGCSQLFVTSASATSSAAVAVSSLDLALTFKLHSNPTANHTIYLDFDGYDLTSSQWENGGALRVGGFYTSLTDAAQQAIQEIWLRVAEDFSPFNINVTTELPTNPADLMKSGTGDTRWGIRVAMTTNRNLVTNASIRNAGGGGTAYLGSFNWATDEVCLVFNGYNAIDAASIYAAAETVSHEVGHTLGLSHDGGTVNPNYYEGHGTGITSWGSIMGAPFINADENVTTWSKGDYIGANNREDDLSIITGSVSNSYVNGNGFTYRLDDYSNSLATAYSLSGTSPSSFGIIERNTDVDWFRFSTGSGTISLSIRNACQVFSSNGDGTFTTQYLDSLGPNLDISAALYTASGVLIATSNVSDRLDASFNLSLAAGDYCLSVEGVGFGTPLNNAPSGYTDYGSLGQYLISGTLIDPVPVPGLIVTPSSGLITSEGGGTASFNVVLATAPTEVVVVSVVSGNQLEGTVSTPSLTFTPENWYTAQTVIVTGVDDNLVDGPKPYVVNLTSALSDSAYSLLSSSVSLTNLDNDQPILSIGAPQTVVEGQITSVTYTVSMNVASPVPVAVAYATANGTATAGTDYTASSGTLSFGAGVTSQTITISLLNDSLNEADETFSLSLSAPTNATLGSPSTVITTLTDTLVASSTTTLPAGIENLRLTGNFPINGTGNSGANVITGNIAANTLKGGGGLDTLTGLDGTDVFDLSGISSAANRCAVTDFLTGLGGETILLSNSLTSRNSPSLGWITVNQASSVTLNTSNFDLFAFNFNNIEADVNLSNSTNGTALLDGLNSANGTATLRTSSSTNGAGYIVAYDNDNAYLYRFNAGGNSAVSATEIALIGILDSSNPFAVGALTSSNFSLV